MRGPLLRNMRVMAGLSAAEVAREARLSSGVVRRVERSEAVAPNIAMQYLLAVERYLQRRCPVAGTVRGLVYEARDLIDEANGRRLPPRRFPRLSEIVGFGDEGRRTDGQEAIRPISSSEDAVAVARRAVRRERFLVLWRQRLENRYQGRPDWYRNSSGMRLLEVLKAEVNARGRWRVELIEDPPRPGFVGWYHRHTWWVEIDPDTGHVESVSHCM